MFKQALFLILFSSTFVITGCDWGAPTSNSSNPVRATSESHGLMMSFPEKYSNVPKLPGGTCDFDPQQVDDKMVNISGWAAISVKDGAIADEIIIGFNANGNEKYVVADRRKRLDVSKYFSNQALDNSGFGVSALKTELPGNSIVIIYQIFQNNTYICASTSLIK